MERRKCTYELGGLTKDISRYSIGGFASLLFAIYSKMQQERDELKKRLLNIKDPGIVWVESCQFLKKGQMMLSKK